ncbi:hypothetical protein JYU34_002367 [Plutella xylostella]|uniref:Cytochrome b5 heme-binding domain-containing protein n=1 Tax=Plutella xylostella TaxID=51655 RepID=A0ABQ7R212_PLUXY|nr:cytochrome b5 [Plutella xylostella]KAG7311329.1 hypothetical protein JYU34_002367 [Plutella xylostella]
MAQVQEMSLPSLSVGQDKSDYLSLTMAALRLVNPWAAAEPAWRPEPEDARDRVITLAEVACHDTYNDCWVVIYDRVYNITGFFNEHPGGADIMLEYAGRDASVAYRGSGHSRMAAKALDRFLIGELPMHERMYRRPGGMRLSDIPD